MAQETNLATALAAAQAELTNPITDAVNSDFGSKYATLANCLDLVRPILAKHHIAFLQVPEYLPGSNGDRGVLVLKSILKHGPSGDQIEATYPIEPATNSPQAIASAITYARRYSLCPMLGIAGEPDDDGNAANNGAQTTPPQNQGYKAEIPHDTPSTDSKGDKTPKGESWADRPLGQIKSQIGITKDAAKLLSQLRLAADDPSVTNDLKFWGEILRHFWETYHNRVRTKTLGGTAKAQEELRKALEDARDKFKLDQQSAEAFG